MTKPLPFTAAGIRRAIEGARSAGLEVTAVTVHPDGAVTVHKVDPTPVAAPEVAEHDGQPNAWGNFQA